MIINIIFIIALGFINIFWEYDIYNRTLVNYKLINDIELSNRTLRRIIFVVCGFVPMIQIILWIVIVLLSIALITGKFNKKYLKYL